MISNSRWTNAKNLLQSIKEITGRLVQAQPVEFAVANIARRIMKLVREEYKGITANASGSPASSLPSSSGQHGHVRLVRSQEPHLGDIPEDTGSISGADSYAAANRLSVISSTSDSSMYNLLAQPEADIDYSRQLFSLKQSIIQAVNELIDELEAVGSNVASQALEHIHANEVILTVGRSKTVEQFLKFAARKRSFQVIVAESAPACSGGDMAALLTAAGIDTVLVSDAAAFAIMSRVNKVIIGCHAVTANGGVIGRTGSRIVAACAKHYSTPVCVVTGMYKVTPIFPENHADFNLIASPDMVVPFSDASLVDDSVQILNPSFDYVPPNLISLLVTNQCGHPPSYVYRLLGELYDPEDYLSSKPQR